MEKVITPNPHDPFEDADANPVIARAGLAQTQRLQKEQPQIRVVSSQYFGLWW